MNKEIRNVPLVSLREGYLAQKAELDAAVARVLESGWYILGSEVEAFERDFSAWCGVPHTVSVANGTDAIIIALRGLGVGAGDAVFTVSHTAVATVAAVELAGAIPVLVDIDETSFTLDPQKLELAIRAAPAGARPRAVIAVHLYGQSCDMDAIADICRRHDLLLIEDCAQAHGATWKGARVGTMGDAASFSFYPTKNLGAFGDGGAVVCRDGKNADLMRAVRQYGWRERYLSDFPGMNSRLDELQAALLRVRLSRLDADIGARRAVAARFDKALTGLVQIPLVRGGAGHAYHLYVVRTPDRNRVAARLKQLGVGTGVHYPQPVHRQRAYEGRVALGPGGLPVTEAVAQDILSLPMYPHLEDADIEHVIGAVRAAVSP